MLWNIQQLCELILSWFSKAFVKIHAKRFKVAGLSWDKRRISCSLVIDYETENKIEK